MRGIPKLPEQLECGFKALSSVVFIQLAETETAKVTVSQHVHMFSGRTHKIRSGRMPLGQKCPQRKHLNIFEMKI